MHYRRLLFFCLWLAPAIRAADSASVVITPFDNEAQTADLNWIGESVSETLSSELSSTGQIVLDRETRAEGYRRLSLKPGSALTKATLFKLGQTLDADFVCYGSFQITLPSASQPRDGSIRISARFLDLRKLRDASEFSETGKVSELSRLEEHLAWQAVRFLNPQSQANADQFLKPSKLVRLDAKESYIRGLLATDREQKQKWMEQAVKLDSGYAQPMFELANLAMRRKDYRAAAAYYGRIPKEDPLYMEAKFRMGLSSYAAGDFNTARNCFRELAGTAPLNEVFNNLGAAESRLNDQAAGDDFRRALEGDSSDATYNFNTALVLYRKGDLDQAARYFRVVLQHAPDDREASALLIRCEQHQGGLAAGNVRPAERLKANFDITAFRQLKAMLQTAK